MTGPASSQTEGLNTTQIAQASAYLQEIAEDENRIPSRPMEWIVLMILAALVGAGAGVVGALFRMALLHLAILRTDMVNWVHANIPDGAGWIVPMIPCAIGAAIACYLTKRLAPQSAGSGIQRVEAVVRDHIRPSNIWILPVKFIGGALAIGSGLALGREGPTVQMGGTVGRLVSDWMRRYVREPWTLIAAGAGAGLAVAFNAPLASLVFVMEELLHRFSARIFTATLVACITGAVVLRAMMSNLNEFATGQMANLSPAVLPSYLILGAIAGLLGVAFNITLLTTLSLSQRLKRLSPAAKGAMVGAAAGLLAWFAPQVVGGGEKLAQSALFGRIPWAPVFAILVSRFILMIMSYSTGAPGGLFAPLLALGALLGNAFAGVESVMLHHPVNPAPYAIVAMASLFTGIVRSPLTGVLLLLEMSGAWPLILPMMAASIMAYSIPQVLRNPPIYESLRKRDEMLERTQWGK